MIRRLLAIAAGRAAAVLLLPILLAGPPSAVAAQDPLELRVMLEAAPATLDPWLATDATGVRISHQLLFQTLLQVNDQLEIAPGVARSWRRVSPTLYRLRIAPGQRFADGSTLDARDVVFTLQSLLDAGSGSPYGAVLREKLKAVRAQGPLEVEVQLKAPYASVLADLIVPIRSRGARAGAAPADPALSGSGPYQLASQSPTEIVLERNPYFGGPPPVMSRVVFKVVQDESTRLLKFYKGDIDLAINALPLDKIDRFRRGGLAARYRVVEGPGLSYQYLGFNLADAALSHPLVRQALSHAINIRALIEYRQRDHAIPAAGLMPPGSPYSDPGTPPAYDPALAERLLDQAGYPPRDGVRLRLVYKTSTDRSAVAQARIIQADLAKVGVALEVRSYEWATFYDDIQKGNFQLYSLRWIGVTDPDFQYDLFHSSQVPPLGRNRGHYHNPGVDKLLLAGRMEADPARRRAIYRALERELASDLPYLSLWHNNNVAVVSTRFTGFRLHPSGGFQHLPEMRLAP